MRPVERGPSPTRPTSRGTQVPIQGKDYSFFRPYLIARLGEYCSYCEVPLGLNLAVEHMLSKTESINENDWNNFLLGCTNCNSHKRAKTKSEDSVLDNFVWPSIDNAVTSNTFDLMTYKKEAKTVSQLIADDVFLDFKDERAKNQKKKLYPDIDTQTYNYVWAYPSALNSAIGKKVKGTIRLVGLNDFIPGNSPDEFHENASDRRVFNRTAAWDRAEKLATLLVTYHSNVAANQLAIDLLKDQIKETAIATGFWSIWMTVFKSKTFADDITSKQILRDLFVDNNVFPGTKYTVR